MLSKTVFLLACAAGALAKRSPLFFLASTKGIAVEPNEFKPHLSAPEVQNILWRYLSSCPTKHYVVVTEPWTLSYSSAFVPTAPNARSTYTEKDIDGEVNIVHVLNTILMDCLHHNVLRVEQLDGSSLPDLDHDTIQKSIMFANLPGINPDIPRHEYYSVMQSRQHYIEDVADKYFHSRDYTLIYMRNGELQVRPEARKPDAINEHHENAEKPLVKDH